jgi:hypothetical protein
LQRKIRADHSVAGVAVSKADGTLLSEPPIVDEPRGT